MLADYLPGGRTYQLLLEATSSTTAAITRQSLATRQTVVNASLSLQRLARASRPTSAPISATLARQSRKTTASTSSPAATMAKRPGKALAASAPATASRTIEIHAARATTSAALASLHAVRHLGILIIRAVVGLAARAWTHGLLAVGIDRGRSSHASTGLEAQPRDHGLTSHGTRREP